MESLDSRDAVLELILELLAEEEFRAGPSAGHGAAGLPARLARRRSTRSSSWIGGAGAQRAHPLTVRLVKGAYWDHEIVEAAQHGWQRAGVRGQGRLRPQLRAAHARGCSTPRRRLRAARRRSPRTTCARSRTRSPTTGSPAAPTPTSSCRSCAGSATRCRPRSPPRACACAPTARSATSWPAWPTSCGGCSRTRRNDSFLHEQARGARDRGAAAPRRSRSDRREGVHERADPRAAAGADPRAARRARWSAHDARPPVQVPVWVGDERARGRRARLDRPRRARPRRGARRPSATPAEVDAALRRCAARARDVGARRRPSERAEVLIARRAVAARAAARGRRAGGPRVRKPWPRGRRRRLRGDRLPRVLRARRASTSRRALPLLQVPGERNELRYARAASSR